MDTLQNSVLEKLKDTRAHFIVRDILKSSVQSILHKQDDSKPTLSDKDIIELSCIQQRLLTMGFPISAKVVQHEASEHLLKKEELSTLLNSNTIGDCMLPNLNGEQEFRINRKILSNSNIYEPRSSFWKESDLAQKRLDWKSRIQVHATAVITEKLKAQEEDLHSLETTEDEQSEIGSSNTTESSSQSEPISDTESEDHNTWMGRMSTSSRQLVTDSILSAQPTGHTNGLPNINSFPRITPASRVTHQLSFIGENTFGNAQLAHTPTTSDDDHEIYIRRSSESSQRSKTTSQSELAVVEERSSTGEEVEELSFDVIENVSDTDQSISF